MVTYAQLEAEVWWGQENVTGELDWLVDALCSFFGVPRANGGIKGDNRHLNGGHRSQAWIKHSQYCTNRTYATEAGLTAEQERDIAAFDVTLPPEHMLTISGNADRATRAGVLEELVEWFGNVDGDQVVDGWDNIRNRVATSDSSHLWHFHGRLARRLLRDINTMRRIYAALTGTEAEDPTMTSWTEPLTQGTPGYAGQQRDTALAFAWQASAEARAGVARLEAAAAADATRDAAVLAAIEGLANAGGVDAAPIVAAVEAVRDEARQRFGELAEQLHDMQIRAEAAEAERDALNARLSQAYHVDDTAPGA